MQEVVRPAVMGDAKYAGVPNTVMSLWQADDASSKDIMVHLYQNLKSGMGKAEALRGGAAVPLSGRGGQVAPVLLGDICAGGGWEAVNR